MYNLYLWTLSKDILESFSWLVWTVNLRYWSACDLWVPYVHVLYASSWCVTNRFLLKPHCISGLKRPTERKRQPYSRLQLLGTQYRYTTRTGSYRTYHIICTYVSYHMYRARSWSTVGTKLKRYPSAKFEQPVHLMSLSRLWTYFSLLQSCQAL